MEKEIYQQFSVEEKVLTVMKREQRSTYWLAKKWGKSQTYVYRMLIGPGKKKKALTKELLDLIKGIWPNDDFSEPKLSHDIYEELKEKAKDLKNEN